MAILTTTGGSIIFFNPDDVFALGDHNDTTGEASTCVYGVIDEMVMIRETVPGFMQRVLNPGDFAQLTRPNNWPVWVRASAIGPAKIRSAITVGRYRPFRSRDFGPSPRLIHGRLSQLADLTPHPRQARPRPLRGRLPVLQSTKIVNLTTANVLIATSPWNGPSFPLGCAEVLHRL